MNSVSFHLTGSPRPYRTATSRNRSSRDSSKRGPKRDQVPPCRDLNSYPRFCLSHAGPSSHGDTGLLLSEICVTTALRNSHGQPLGLNLSLQTHADSMREGRTVSPIATPLLVHDLEQRIATLSLLKLCCGRIRSPRVLFLRRSRRYYKGNVSQLIRQLFF